MSYSPKHNNKAKIFSFVFLLGAIVVWMIGAYIGRFYWVVQLAAILMMVVGTQLLGRFVLIDYKYVVQDNNYNGYDFLIYKIQGKKVTKVCYVSLSKVIAIFRLTDLPDYQKKYGRTSNRFNYCVNIGAKETFVLIFRDGKDLIEVRFEPDRKFADDLVKIAALPSENE